MEPGGFRRAAGEHDGWYVGACCSHELGWDSFVAAAEEDDRVERVGTNALLDIHCHQVSIEHGGGLHQVLPERDRRELQWEPSAKEDAALDCVGELAKVEIAVDELRPGVADADYRSARERGARDAFGVDGGAVNEAGKVMTSEPLRASQ